MIDGLLFSPGQLFKFVYSGSWAPVRGGDVGIVLRGALSLDYTQQSYLTLIDGQQIILKESVIVPIGESER